MSKNIYSAENTKAWDQFTINQEPISSADLMERAATLCTKHILATNLFNSVAIFCGTGNNGGDGLVIARLLHERDIDVHVIILAISKNPSTDFILNQDRLPKKIKVIHLSENNTNFDIHADLVIDAIFGSGLTKSISGWVGDVIDRVNKLQKSIVSVDLPSGLFCIDNRSNDFNHVIEASQTITFQSPKMSFLFSKYQLYTGNFKIIDIGLSEKFDEAPFARFVTRSDINLKKRNTFSHKGSNGYLLVIAGFQNYAGAAVLASRAAFRTGCGYVATHCSAESKSILLNALPECLYVNPIHTHFPEKTKAIAIGPGLGTDEYALNILTKVLEENHAVVMDADALNLLSSHRALLEKIPINSILTPHAAELARLIGKSESPEEFLENQLAFSKKHHVYIIQKGAYSKITTPDGNVFVNSTGNAGMGTAGAGDVLTGIIGSLLAQGYSSHEAAIFGTFIHGYAADLVKREHGEAGMIASDIIDYLPKTLNSF